MEGGRKMKERGVEKRKEERREVGEKERGEEKEKKDYPQFSQLILNEMKLKMKKMRMSFQS